MAYGLIAGALLACLVGARVVEASAGSSWRSRDALREVIRTATHTTLFAVALLLVARPVSAMLIALGVLVGLAVANVIKIREMREPVVFSDLALVAQALRFPRLYHLDPRDDPRPLAGIVLLLVVAVLAASLERPVVAGLPVLGAAAVLLAVHALLVRRLAPRLRADLLAPPDFGSRSLGTVTAITLQFALWLGRAREPQPVVAAPAPLPKDVDMVVMQLESFHDPARHDPTATTPRGWDDLRQRSVLCGPLRVEVFGANTMRTEFSVLTGHSGTALGTAVFYPSLLAPDLATHSPVARLARAGVETIFVHPNDARFFRRDRVVPRFGFARIVAAEDFQDAKRVGPHVADDELAAMVERCLAGASRPRFLMAVSMEAHGPWHDGRLEGLDGRAALATHLDNSAAAAARVWRFLQNRERRALLVVYGDHQPSLSVASGAAALETDYVVLDTDTPQGTGDAPRSLAAHELLTTALARAARR